MRHGEASTSLLPHVDAHRLYVSQVVAVPMPLREDPEVTLGALRWTIDQVYRPGDVMHLVHVIKCLVHKLEVFHGDRPKLFSPCLFCSTQALLPESAKAR